MRTSTVLLALALAVSLAVNAWLTLTQTVRMRSRSPSIGTPAPTAAAPPPPAAETKPGAPEGLASFARVVEEAERARKAARSDGKKAAETRGRPLVDARVILEAQCRHARGKAEEAFRHDADGIRKYILLSEPDSGLQQSAVASERDQLADVIGTEPTDPAVVELAERRKKLEADAVRGMQAALATEPPDWRTAFDVVIDCYRKQDAEARRLLGEERAQEVMLADVDGRAGILAIGSSLVGEPWEAGASSLQ